MKCREHTVESRRAKANCLSLWARAHYAKWTNTARERLVCVTSQRPCIDQSCGSQRFRGLHLQDIPLFFVDVKAKQHLNAGH
jgi:hypothetical protein